MITSSVCHKTAPNNGTSNTQNADGAAYYSTLNVRHTQCSGPVHFADVPQTAGATYQTGQDITVRGTFVNQSKLTNTKDTYYRAIDDAWPVFALAHDLGSFNAASSLVVYSIGHVRDPAVNYIVKGGLQLGHMIKGVNLLTATQVARCKPGVCTSGRNTPRYRKW
jgi:hypothetical protein